MRRRLSIAALAALAVLCGLCGRAQGSPARSWAAETIYFVLTDRFCDGDASNNNGVRKSEIARYHGGDIQGIIDRLDYLAQLGVTALWVSPCMKNQAEFMDSEGYHGYWVLDFYRTDEHQGSLEKFREMVEKAHRRGLKVLLDLPLNSLAWEHPFVRDPGKSAWFHHGGAIKSWDDEKECEEGSLFGLPDLAHENGEVADYLIGVARWWARRTGVDGFRLDAVKHVPRAFWTRFCRELHDEMGERFFLLGEDFSGNPAHVAAYRRTGMDSLFDFPLCFAARSVFARGESMRKLGECLAEGDRAYGNPQMMSLMLENHDMSRFMTEAEAEGRERLELALAFLFTVHRIPTVYYGLEAGMEGAYSLSEGPLNRADMAWGKSPDLRRFFTVLSRLRRDVPALQAGGFRGLKEQDDVYAYARTLPGSTAVIVLNRSARAVTMDLPLPPGSSLRKGAKLRDALLGGRAKVTGDGIRVRIGARRAAIFIEAAAGD